MPALKRTPAPARRRLLILGGTAEAATLAEASVARFGDGLEVISALAGRTRQPGPLKGAVRIGGFGGADGLAEFIRARAVDLVIDATHPFAETISANAQAACANTGRARLVIERPPWKRAPGDRWIEVADMAAAAAEVAHRGTRVLLTVGERPLARF